MSSNQTGVTCKSAKLRQKSAIVSLLSKLDVSVGFFPPSCFSYRLLLHKKKEKKEAALSSIPLKCDTLYGVACWKANTAGVWHFNWNPAAAFGGEADTLLSFSSCQNIWAAVWRAVVQRVCSAVAAASAEKTPGYTSLTLRLGTKNTET